MSLRFQKKRFIDLHVPGFIQLFFKQGKTVRLSQLVSRQMDTGVFGLTLALAPPNSLWFPNGETVFSIDFPKINDFKLMLGKILVTTIRRYIIYQDTVVTICPSFLWQI